MTGSRWARWGLLAAIGGLAAVFASFNSRERVALSLGFTELYRVPLVVLIFVAFLAGMVTMFLLGLRHDLRVRQALREAGFGEPIAAEEAAARWEEEPETDERLEDAVSRDTRLLPHRDEATYITPERSTQRPETEPPPP